MGGMNAPPAVFEISTHSEFSDLGRGPRDQSAASVPNAEIETEVAFTCRHESVPLAFVAPVAAARATAAHPAARADPYRVREAAIRPWRVTPPSTAQTELHFIVFAGVLLLGPALVGCAPQTQVAGAQTPF